MDTPMERADESPCRGELGKMERREFLTKAAAAGAITWAAPVILSRPASAAVGSPGCATISVDCARFTCPGPESHAGTYPGFTITVNCSCSPGGGPISPPWCVTFSDNGNSPIRPFTVSGNCPDTQLDEADDNPPAKYCVTTGNSRSFIMGQGGGNPLPNCNQYPIVVDIGVRVTCGTGQNAVSHCQTFRVRWECNQDTGALTCSKPPFPGQDFCGDAFFLSCTSPACAGTV
jgi:hypothetical protein